MITLYWQRDSAKRDSAKRVSAKRDSAKRDSAKRDSAKRDSAKRDSAKRDSAKRDSVKRDSAKRDSAKREDTDFILSSCYLIGSLHPMFTLRYWKSRDNLSLNDVTLSSRIHHSSTNWPLGRFKLNCSSAHTGVMVGKFQKEFVFDIKFFSCFILVVLYTSHRHISK